MQWLITNFSTIVISFILLIVVSLIVYNLVKNKREGKTTCDCGCSNCAMSSVCHKQEKELNKTV